MKVPSAVALVDYLPEQKRPSVSKMRVVDSELPPGVVHSQRVCARKRSFPAEVLGKKGVSFLARVYAELLRQGFVKGHHMRALERNGIFFLVELGRQFRVGVLKTKVRYFFHLATPSALRFALCRRSTGEPGKIPAPGSALYLGPLRKYNIPPGNHEI